MKNKSQLLEMTRQLVRENDANKRIDLGMKLTELIMKIGG